MEFWIEGPNHIPPIAVQRESLRGAQDTVRAIMQPSGEGTGLAQLTREGGVPKH